LPPLPITLMMAPRPRLPGLDHEDLFEEPVTIAVPRDHPVAANEIVALADLAAAPWATGNPGGGMSELVRRVCNGHGGFEPRIRHHTNELGMLLALVEHEVPRLSPGDGLRELVVVPAVEVGQALDALLRDDVVIPVERGAPVVGVLGGPEIQVL